MASHNPFLSFFLLQNERSVCVTNCTTTVFVGVVVDGLNGAEIGRSATIMDTCEPYWGGGDAGEEWHFHVPRPAGAAVARAAGPKKGLGAMMLKGAGGGDGDGAAPAGGMKMMMKKAMLGVKLTSGGQDGAK